MNELMLKYGCNPNQKPARVFAEDDMPITVLNGQPGYINLLDALNAWQLVKELGEATGLPAATSFKHVSPAGAAIGLPLSDTLKQIYFTGDDELSPIACAYARARGADRMSSFGDFAAMSCTVDLATAKLLKKEVSDGVIAPDYTPEALEMLRAKRGGKYLVIKVDANYVPPAIENKTLFGITFEQGRNDLKIDRDCLSNIVSANKDLPDSAVLDLIVSLITLKYTQSNSVCYALGGQAIGIGAGQQSRVHCTRLAGNKADIWYLRQHPSILGLNFTDKIKRPDRDNIIDQLLQTDAEDYFAIEENWKDFVTQKPYILTKADREQWLATMDGVALGSDAFFPFGDNIERAHKSGVKYIAEAGGSIRDDNVIAVCDKYGMVLSMTGIRLFHH